MEYSDYEEEYEDMDDSDKDEKEELAVYYEVLAEKRRKLSGGFNPKALKVLCLDGIVHNSDFFLKVEQLTNLDPLVYVPNFLKAELLGLNNKLKKWERWQELLLNRKVTNLEIDVNLLSSARFLMSLIMKKPQLKTFTCSGQLKQSSDSIKHLVDPVGFACAFLECFGNLESLKVQSFTCNDSHLETIANNLLNLSTLNLELGGDVTAKGISALSKLEHLQNFPFKSKSPLPNKMTRLYNLCLQHLPHLLLFGWDEESNLVERGFYDVVVNIDEDFNIDFQSLATTPVELCLQQLVLHNQVGVIPESITFPNLRSLVLWDPPVDFELDARFSKVENLVLIELGMSGYCSILRILGFQIRRLAIVSCEGDLFLDLLLNLCANLEEFHIPTTPDLMSCSLPLEPAVVQKLRVLEIDMVFYDDGSLVSEFSPGTLLQLLRAPNLQKLRLFSIDLTEQDAEEIIRLLKEGQILQKLERLDVQHICIERKGMNDRHFRPDLRHRYDLVLENMAKYCPCFVYYKEHSFM